MENNAFCIVAATYLGSVPISIIINTTLPFMTIIARARGCERPAQSGPHDSWKIPYAGACLTTCNRGMHGTFG